MRNLRRPAVAVHDHAQGVRDLEAIGETHARGELIDHVRAERLVAERAVPQQPVANRGPKAASAHDVVAGHVELPPGAGRAVRLRQPGHDAREVIAPARVRHAERSEDALAGELLKRLPAHALHDGVREQEAGVGVGVMIADRIVERLLRGNQSHDIGVRVHPQAAWPALERHEIAPLAKSGRVGQQVPDRDRASVGWQLGEVFAGVVVE